MQSRQPENQKNLLLAIVLSVGVLLAWQYFYAGPKTKLEQEARKQAELKKQDQRVSAPSSGAPPAVQAPSAPSGQPPQPAASATPNGSPPTDAGRGGAAPSIPSDKMTSGVAREMAVKTSPRAVIATSAVEGSINLKGGRIDDVKLMQYRETLDPNSAHVILFSPAEAPDPYFAEFGWVAAPGTSVALPDRDTVWSVVGNNVLKPGQPVTLVWANSVGVRFSRTISIDDNYMFKIEDKVENKSAQPITLYPYGRIYHYGTPILQGASIAHEGLIGFLGKEGYKEISYSTAIGDKNPKEIPNISGGWLGFTAKYWASALIPGQDRPFTANLKGIQKVGTQKEAFQADYLAQAITVTPGTTGTATSQLFAGAKRVALVETYWKDLNIERFDLLIDWGWFHFITRPMFYLINWLYGVLGNFGVAILAVTVLVKLLFFPLANKSYESMAKMKKLQPEMERLRDRYKEDKARQQQALMELYQKEKVNPLAGCLPILIQIPVFFALYKVLFVTLDMRHAPFFGWIQDLSATDPTSLFNLFGLLPFPAPEAWLLGHTIGAWPILMGATMWFQMQLNPQQPDPIQQQIFNWMPILFTFLLAGFSAGLVIYWFWNNILSIAQQWVIMKRQGVDVPLVDNLKKTLDPVLKLIGGSARK